MNSTKLILLEGSRGTGKSTLAFQLRQTLKDSTLVNFTGFNIDGEIGLKKITGYYLNWLIMFLNMQSDKIEQTIICDRIFFSEMVYSTLYKSYDFEHTYQILVEMFSRLNPIIFYLTINDEEELSKRLQREKIPFHNVEESVKETLKQQNEYDKIFDDLMDIFNIVKIDTTSLGAEQVKELVLSHINK
jgi:thymidylate kinase